MIIKLLQKFGGQFFSLSLKPKAGWKKEIYLLLAFGWLLFGWLPEIEPLLSPISQSSSVGRAQALSFMTKLGPISK